MRRLQNYVDWHSNERKYHLNDSSARYLTVVCHLSSRCGGIAMRLKSIPFYLEVANKTNRVLFIKWEKFQLEDFLVPPEGGLDWRLPDGIDIGNKPDAISKEIFEILNSKHHLLHNKKNLVVRPNVELLDTKTLRSEQKPLGMGSYSNIMDILFTPVPSLEKEIGKTMRSLGLKRKKYVAAHYRPLTDNYMDIDDKTIYDMHRAIDCAVHAAGDDRSLRVYFTSYQTHYVDYILNDSPYSQSRKSPVKVVGVDHAIRLHSDKSHLGYEDPTTLYPAFIDLWLMKYSKCASYGHLGFGKFGSHLSGDCIISHISWSIKCPKLV